MVDERTSENDQFRSFMSGLRGVGFDVHTSSSYKIKSDSAGIKYMKIHLMEEFLMCGEGERER